MAIVGQYKLYGYSFDSLRGGMEVTDEVCCNSLYHMCILISKMGLFG